MKSVAKLQPFDILQTDPCHETPSLENDIVARALADIGDPAVAVVANVLAHGDTRQLRSFDDDSLVYGFYLDTFSVTSRPRYRS